MYSLKRFNINRTPKAANTLAYKGEKRMLLLQMFTKTWENYFINDIITIQI